MIIVEGMDNSGKTTLVEQLINEQDFQQPKPIKVKKSPGPVTLGEGLSWVVKAMKNYNPRLIYDRFHPISERVYGPVVRRGDMYGSHTFDLLRIMVNRDPVIIYCRPPIEKIEKWGERDQMNGVKGHSTELIRRYDWLMEYIKEISCGKVLLLKYDYTRGEMAYNEVRAVVNSYLASHTRQFEPFIGADMAEETTAG